MQRRRFMLLAVALVALNCFFWIAQSGFALPKSLIGDFFGPRMVRAEVLVVAQDGTTQDYFIDQGVITQLSSSSVTLRERNGDARSIALAPNVAVHMGAHLTTVRKLRVGTAVTVFRIGTAPAATIDVTGPSSGR